MGANCEKVSHLNLLMNPTVGVDQLLAENRTKRGATIFGQGLKGPLTIVNKPLEARNASRDFVL